MMAAKNVCADLVAFEISVVLKKTSRNLISPSFDVTMLQDLKADCGFGGFVRRSNL